MEQTKLVEKLEDVDAADQNGKTALLHAVEKADLPTVESILKCHPNSDNQYNKKSIITAIRSYDNRLGNKEKEDREAIIKQLFLHGFTVEVQDCDVLYESIYKELFFIVEEFLEHREVNSDFFKACLDHKGRTLLHVACKSGTVDLVGKLLDKGAEINATAKDGTTPLHQAVIKECEKTVELLLNRGANVDCEDQYGHTALSYAALLGERNIVGMVLNRGPDVKSKANRRSILAGTISDKANKTLLDNYNEIVKLLHGYGFRVNPDYINDFDLAEKAIVYGRPVILEEFLEHHASDFLSRYMAVKEYMPLHLAARCTKKDVIELLVKYGFDVNAKDHRGQSPLFHAVITATLLFNKSQSPTEGIDNDCVEIVQLLLRFGADPNVIDVYRRTALHYAVSYRTGMEKTARLLLSYGTSIEEHSRILDTPLHIAIKHDNISLQLVFLEHIIADFEDSLHRDLLRVASEKGNDLILEAPLRLGANINNPDLYRRTPLVIACKNGYRELVISLLEHGCDLTAILKLVREYGETEFFRSDIKHVLKMHIAKLTVAGLNKTDVGLYIHEGTTEFVTKCKRELKTLEKNFPHTAVRFFDFLTEDKTRLATYAKNEIMVEYLLSLGCKRRFPLYWNVIKACIWKGIVRKVLVEKSINAFRTYGGMFLELPDVCVENILSYMSDDELRVFIQFDITKEKFSDLKGELYLEL